MVLLAVLPGCSDPEPLPPPPPDIELGKPEAKRPVATLSNALAGATRGPLRVQVREVRQAGTYTVLQVGDAEANAPVLAPALLVEVGAMVEIGDYVLRRGFALDGVGAFDALLIAMRVVGPGVRHQLHLTRAGADVKDLPPGHPPAPEQGVPLAETLTPSADRIAAIPEGLPSIAELRANREELAWRGVAVRGLVTGRTLGSLGRNWLQLEDGSGGRVRLPLLVSTQSAPPLGELVRAQGMLHIHEDVGAGVVHAVLLAEATVTVDNEAEPGEAPRPDRAPGSNGDTGSAGAGADSAAKPAGTAKPADTTRPTNAAKPADAAKPTDAAKPANAANPAKTEPAPIPPPPDEPPKDEEP